MSIILDRCRVTNNIVFDANYLAGSIADKSPYAAAATVTSPVSWVNTKLGYGLLSNATGLIYYNSNTNNRLAGSSATFIILGNFNYHIASSRLISKRDGVKIDYEIYANSTTGLILYDWTNLSVMTGSIVNRKLIVITLVSGSYPLLYLDGNYISQGSLTNTIPNNTTPPNLCISNFYTGAFPLKNSLNRVTILNSALSSSEISQLYTELMSERYPIRAYSFGSRISAPTDPPGCPSLLKTDFTTKLPDGRLADLSGNGWHGTIRPGFVAGPGMFGNALMANSASRTYVDFGDVTPINGATKLTTIWYGIKASYGDAKFLMCKGSGTTARNEIYSTNTVLVWTIGANKNIAGTFTLSTAKQFICSTYDGLLANDSKFKLSIDTLQLSSASSADIPATLPNTVGTNLVFGMRSWDNVYPPPAQNEFFVVYPYALTPEQISFIYRQIARRSTFALDMQRVPVSLANMVGPCEVPNTPFRVNNGTWKVSEDTSGKHWFESVATDLSTMYMPCTQAYGTYVFDIYHTAASEYVFFITNKLSLIDNARNAYGIRLVDSTILLSKYAPSGATTILTLSNVAIELGKKYTCAVSRSSPGEFILWLKTGSTWDKVITTSGTNPATDATYNASSYFAFGCGTAASAGKFSQPRFFQGALSLDQLQKMC